MSLRELAPKGALIFDWDDTKVNTFWSCLGLYASFAKAYGLKEPQEDAVRALWGRPLQILIPGIYPDTDPEGLVEKFQVYMAEIGFCIQPFEGITETTQKLKEMGYVLGVVSSTHRQGLENTFVRYLADLPRESYTFIFTAEDSTVHKPDPAVFDGAFEELEKLGVDSNRVVYIGDGINDFKAARDRGIGFIAITAGFATREDFISEGLDEKFILGSVNELPEWLEKNQGLLFS